MTPSLLGLEGKKAIVTGAGQGLGRAFALLLARAGASVAVADIDASLADSVAKEARALGVDAIPVHADLRRDADVAKLVAATLERFGAIDIAVNNVGGLGGHKVQLVAGSADAFWDDIIELNLRVTFLCARAFATAMIARKTAGVIINITSVAGMRGSPGMAPYGAAKAGVIQFTQTLAQELGPHGIRVNCVAPFRVETPAMLKYVTPENRESTAQAVPLRRLAKPEDVAGMVVALASDLARHVTGQTIAVDGGAMTLPGYSQTGLAGLLPPRQP